MARIKVEVEDLLPNQKLVIAIVQDEDFYDDDPDPGEEAPEEEHSPHLMAVGGKR